MVRTRVGRGFAAELEPASKPARGLPQLAGGLLTLFASLRPATNSRLRTGTDQGNPTV